jgi:hypothetical protein
MRHWTPEERSRQAALIRQWKPWERSTGPQTKQGKATVAKNAFKGEGRQILRMLAKTLRKIDSTM